MRIEAPSLSARWSGWPDLNRRPPRPERGALPTGPHFPVDKVAYSYNVMYNAFKRLSKDYTDSERAAMFHDTAARVYRVDV